MDWRHRAVCRDEDPELFFPVGTSGPALAQQEQAKAVCRRCPVASQCLAWALQTGQDAGVWGGMSEDERRALKRRTARPRARAHRRRRGRLPAYLVADVHRLAAAGRSTEEMVAELGVSLHTVTQARHLVLTGGVDDAL